MFGSKETSPTFSGRIWISYFGCSFILSLSRICSLVPVGSIELCISISVIPECAEAFCSKSLPLLQVVVDVIFAEIFLFFFFSGYETFYSRIPSAKYPKFPLSHRLLLLWDTCFTLTTLVGNWSYTSIDKRKLYI